MISPRGNKARNGFARSRSQGPPTLSWYRNWTTRVMSAKSVSREAIQAAVERAAHSSAWEIEPGASGCRSAISPRQSELWLRMTELSRSETRGRRVTLVIIDEGPGVLAGRDNRNSVPEYISTACSLATLVMSRGQPLVSKRRYSGE